MQLQTAKSREMYQIKHGNGGNKEVRRQLKKTLRTEEECGVLECDAVWVV